MFYRNVIKLPLGFTAHHAFSVAISAVPDVKQDTRRNELSKLKPAEARNIKEKEEVALKKIAQGASPLSRQELYRLQRSRILA